MESLFLLCLDPEMFILTRCSTSYPPFVIPWRPLRVIIGLCYQSLNVFTYQSPMYYRRLSKNHRSLVIIRLMWPFVWPEVISLRCFYCIFFKETDIFIHSFWWTCKILNRNLLICECRFSPIHACFLFFLNPAEVFIFTTAYREDTKLRVWGREPVFKALKPCIEVFQFAESVFQKLIKG